MYCTEQPFVTQFLWCQPLWIQMRGICVSHVLYIQANTIMKMKFNIYKNIWLEKLGRSHGRKMQPFLFCSETEKTHVHTVTRPLLKMKAEYPFQN